MKSFILLFLITFCGMSAKAIDCIGPTSASRFVVYLHGMDTPIPGNLEMRNRAALETVANKLNIRFALPRATNDCPSNPNLKCWSWTEQDSIESVLEAINFSANICFPHLAFSLLGFSNGGYAVHKMMRKCSTGNFTQMISFGASGGWSKNDPQDLANCPLNLSMNIGSTDEANSSPSVAFYQYLKSINAQVSYSKYLGGHELTLDSLTQSLTTVRASPSN